MTKTLFWSSAWAVKSSLDHFLPSMLPFVWNYHQHRAWIWKERQGLRWFDGTLMHFISFSWMTCELYAFWNPIPSSNPSNSIVAPAKDTQKLPSVRPPWLWVLIVLCSPPRGRGSTHVWEGFVGQILQDLGWNSAGFQEKMAMHSVLNGNMRQKNIHKQSLNGDDSQFSTIRAVVLVRLKTILQHIADNMCRLRTKKLVTWRIQPYTKSYM